CGGLFNPSRGACPRCAKETASADLDDVESPALTILRVVIPLGFAGALGFLGTFGSYLFFYVQSRGQERAVGYLFDGPGLKIFALGALAGAILGFGISTLIGGSNEKPTSSPRASRRAVRGKN